LNKSNRDSKIVCYSTFASFPSTAAHSIHIINMCESMTKFGHEVVLMADILESPEEIFDHYGIKHPFHLENIHLKKIRFLGRFLALRKMFFLIKKRKPNLLYTRDIFNGWLAGKSKIPFIFELHELPGGKIRRFLLSRILSSANLEKIVFISKSMKIKFENDFPHSKVERCVAHDGVNLTQFNPIESKEELRKIFGLPPNKYVAGYTGSLFQGRGIEIILDLAQRIPEVLFVFAGGEGNCLLSLKKKLEDLNLDNVVPLGYIPNKSIPGILKTCDVLLMPYQEQVLQRQAGHDTVQYMSPLKMFEYMAAEKPIISSRIPVLEEILQDNKNSIFVKPADVHGWENALKKLKNDKNLAQKISVQARKDVADYTWDQRTKLIFKM